jgi:hypothetical protein
MILVRVELEEEGNKIVLASVIGIDSTTILSEV